MTYLKPEELQDWHIKIIAERFGRMWHGKDFYLAWYRIWYEFANEKGQPRGLDDLHDRFALARLKGQT